MHRPDYRRRAGEARHKSTNQIGVIQPRLYHVWTELSDDPLQPPQCCDAQAPPLHAKRGYGYSLAAKLMPIDSLPAQGHDCVLEGSARNTDEPVEHGLGPALTEIRDDVQDPVDRVPRRRIIAARPGWLCRSGARCATARCARVL
jgi:hypothetical protein